MAAENCSVVDPWPHHRSDSWFSDALFASNNEALARALRIAVSNSIANSSVSEDAPAAVASPDTLSASTASTSFLLFNQLPANDMGGRRRGGPMVSATGRVGKRKSRASKRTSTTYINADPASFREMVQKVTGVRTNADVGEPVGMPLRPSVEIRAVPDLQQMCLPTLDTSAFLLDRGGLMPAVNGNGFLGPAAVDGPGLDVDAFLPSFPTLESWGIM